MLRNLCVLLLIACGIAFGQGMVEYGAVSGSTATAINSSGKQLGGSLGSIMGKVTASATGEQGQPAAKGNAARAKAKGPALPTPKDVADTRTSAKPEDIKTGMTKDELIAAAGKPYIKISMEDDGHAVERFSYLLKDGGKFGVELTDGKVTEVKPVQPE
jgi:hypothetical protein